jgi:hypothetical protein
MVGFGFGFMTGSSLTARWHKAGMASGIGGPGQEKSRHR